LLLVPCAGRGVTTTDGWFWPNQFEAQANADIHRRTTGPEILQAFGNVPLHHFVCAYGTGGTINGVGQYLRQASPTTQLHVCEPDNAPLLYSQIPTTYPADGIPSSSFLAPHPAWRPHLFQGWTADFIPKLVAEAQAMNLIDSVRTVGGDEAMAMCRALAAQEGILSGPSGGGVVASAIKLAEECPPGTNILALVADTGERYLSTPLFEDIPADMTVEEKKWAASTPSQSPPAPGLPAVVPAAVDFVNNVNRDHPVVVWSLQYCEFCWTLTRFLDALAVPYHQINIDNFVYAQDNLGNQYRSALSAQTGCQTFPQLFINNAFVGGAVDACLMWKKGELQPLLDRAGLNRDCNYNGYQGDPFEFLPKWMTQNPHRAQ
jgi:cysteine synthase